MRHTNEISDKHVWNKRLTRLNLLRTATESLLAACILSVDDEHRPPKVPISNKIVTMVTGLDVHCMPITDIC
jgi:hypothetical protein